MTFTNPSLAARAAARFHFPASTKTITGHWPIVDGTGADAMVLASITIRPASDEACSEGLLAFLALDFGKLLRIDGVTMRVTSQGSLTLSFPSRTSPSGARFSIVRPIDAAARASIERTIFKALELQEPVQS